jgi:hypothetical protein
MEEKWKNRGEDVFSPQGGNQDDYTGRLCKQVRIDPGNRIFFGALDYHKLSLPDRMILKALRAHEGDFRDWPAIDAWEASIARDLG